MTSDFTTTDALEGIDGTRTETAAAVNAGIAATGPRQLIDDATIPRFFTQLAPAGSKLHVIDVEDLEEKYRDRPRRKTGKVHVHDAASFVSYLDKHSIPETEVWANSATTSLVAVINAHEQADGAESATMADLGAGYGDHRVNLELIKTPAWLAWAAKDKQWLGQTDFAEHIEDNALDVVSPDSATMLEIAESFQATTRADFKSAQRLHDGQVALRYEETQGARAGENGDVEIPKVFTIDVAPFEGSGTYTVEARFRYRLSGSQLLLSYHLVNPRDVLQQAFADYVTHVENAIEAPIFRGRPE